MPVELDLAMRCGSIDWHVSDRDFCVFRRTVHSCGALWRMQVCVTYLYHLFVVFMCFFFGGDSCFLCAFIHGARDYLRLLWSFGMKRVLLAVFFSL